MYPQQTQPIDTDVKNLVSAMGQVETGTSSPEAYTKRGASGEFGRYQFMPDTWKEWSSESGISTELEQSSMEEQNKVAYNKVKEWKDSGLNPAQIASKWNSGDENAYRNNNVGTNSQGVSFDTPEHVRKVSQAYNEIKSRGLGGNYTPPPETEQFTPATQSGVETLTDQIGAGGSLMSDLGNTFNEAGTKASDAVQRGFSGESDPFSAGYQAFGAGLGTVGGVIDAGLKNAPIIGGAYEGATNLIGGGIQGAMNTETGQKIKEGYDNLSPDTQRNIGATLDILSVFPMFKALKLGNRGIRDASTGLREAKVTKQATDEIESTVSKGTGRNLERAKGRGLDPVKIILDDPKHIPEIIEQNGKYIYETKQGVQALQRTIDADELALQNLLKSTIDKNVGVDLALVRKTVLNDLMPKGKINVNKSAITRELNRLFNDISESAGRNIISLSDLNSIKRQVRSGINFDAIDPTRALTRQVQFDVGQSLMTQVEKIAKKAGVTGVKEINQSMGGKLTAQSILEDLGGKAIKSGSTGKDGLIKSVAKTIPGVEGIVDYATKGLPSTATRKLRDRRPLKETARKGLVQLGAGLGLSSQ